MYYLHVLMKALVKKYLSTVLVIFLCVTTKPLEREERNKWTCLGSSVLSRCSALIRLWGQIFISLKTSEISVLTYAEYYNALIFMILHNGANGLAHPNIPIRYVAARRTGCCGAALHRCSGRAHLSLLRVVEGRDGDYISISLQGSHQTISHWK